MTWPRSTQALGDVESAHPLPKRPHHLDNSQLSGSCIESHVKSSIYSLLYPLVLDVAGTRRARSGTSVTPLEQRHLIG